MRLFQPIPQPRYGRTPQVHITDLLQLKSVADKWKTQLQDIKGPFGTKVKHANSLEMPTLTTLSKVEPADAVLLPIVGGQLFNKLLKKIVTKRRCHRRTLSNLSI